MSFNISDIRDKFAQSDFARVNELTGTDLEQAIDLYLGDTDYYSSIAQYPELVTGLGITGHEINYVIEQIYAS